MKNLLLLSGLLLCISCANQPRTYESIDLQFASFDWDVNPYKFSQVIRDSVLPDRGDQYASWAYSYIGDIQTMHETWDSDRNPQTPLTEEEKEDFGSYQPVDGMTYILEKAKDYQVVIINEGHHMPQHRVFSAQLLEELQKQGFKHLGLESYYASPQNDSTLKALGYPTLKSGYYTKEPQFGNLLRQAHRMGIQIFGYESEGHADGKEREINQAKNIQTYLEQHPGEKVLIHCGFGHVKEGELMSPWEKAMAGRLEEFTGLDPLTINQVGYSEHSAKKHENPYYQLTDVETPMVYLNEAGEVFGQTRNGGYTDISIFHPRSQTYNRPVWMTYGDRKEVDFSFEEAEVNCPCLVFAYPEGEEVGLAVPYDIQETATKQVKLVLDKSDYQLVILDQAGKALLTKWEN